MKIGVKVHTKWDKTQMMEGMVEVELEERLEAEVEEERSGDFWR